MLIRQLKELLIKWEKNNVLNYEHKKTKKPKKNENVVAQLRIDFQTEFSSKILFVFSGKI